MMSSHQSGPCSRKRLSSKLFVGWVQPTNSPEKAVVFFEPQFDESRFFQGAREVLDAIAVFWDGLEDDRLHGLTG